MKTPRRISIELLDDALKTMINAGSKIFPVSYDYVAAETNPEGYEFVRIIEAGNHRNEIYIWRTDTNAWELIGADDYDVAWEDVTGKPVAFPPADHSHTKEGITDFAHTHTREEITDFIHTHDYAPANHIHDARYYVKSEVDNLVSGKAPADHNHDGRYNTKSEVTSMLSGKSNIGHTHDYSPSNHNHDSNYAGKSIEITVSEIDQRLSDIENGYTEGHWHDNKEILDKVSYSGTSQNIDLKDIEDYTQALGEKSDIGHGHTKGEIADFNHTHTKQEITDFSHDHDDRYYTETEINSKLALKADTTSLSGHVGNSSVHVTSGDKTNWNAKTSISLGQEQPMNVDLWLEEIS